MHQPNMNQRILVVDDEDRIRQILSMLLRDDGYVVETAPDGVTAVQIASKFIPQVMIVDLQMPRMDGIETIARVKEKNPGIVAIILTAHGTIQSAVQAIKEGVYDYIPKPFDNDQILLAVHRAFDVLRLKEEVDGLRTQLQKDYGLSRILGETEIMRKLREQIVQIAKTDATVLIEGESGTGKELAARAIHFESERKSRPFVIVDCTAIPTNLVESEFFGHEKGSFTGAYARKTGKFEEANLGTVFLDEIGELPLEAQTKLLRVLQEREFNPIGTTIPTKVNVRVIAATNKNLEEQTRQGRFREDLFYRLNVLKLAIPPLRVHKDDIPLYVEHFLEKHRSTLRKGVTRISEGALEALSMHEWPGNIRELENTIQRALLNASSPRIEKEELNFLALQDHNALPMYYPAQGLVAYIKAVSTLSEREIIVRTLRETEWNRTETARRLMVSRKTLFNKIHQYHLEPPGSGQSDSA